VHFPFLFSGSVFFKTIGAALDDFGDLFSEVRLNIAQPRQATFILNCIV